MTKLTKKSIIVTSLLLIVVLIFSRVYIQSKLTNNDAILNEYNSKRQELSTKQEQLQSQINNLNVMLQTEITRQNSLSDQLSQLTGQPSNQINPVNSPTIPNQPAPAPVVVPQTTRTRAS
jgi:hypothetical protein